MNKLVAIINVIAWSGFWAFGYIVVTFEGLSSRQLTIAAILAFVGFVTGVLAYMKLIGVTEQSGYAWKSNQLDAETRRRAQMQGSV